MIFIHYYWMLPLQSITSIIERVTDERTYRLMYWVERCATKNGVGLVVFVTKYCTEVMLQAHKRSRKTAGLRSSACFTGSSSSSSLSLSTPPSRGPRSSLWSSNGNCSDSWYRLLPSLATWWHTNKCWFYYVK